MINKIKSETILVSSIAKLEYYNDKYNYLGENDINILIDKAIGKEKIIALNIDNYYISLSLPKMPKTADFLITLNEEKHIYTIYIVEMKNAKRLSSFRSSDIIDKFQTTIDDFMKVRYSDIFMNEEYKIELKLFFISDPLKLKEKDISELEIQKRIKSTKLEFLSQVRPFEFRKRLYQIQYEIPHPLISLKK